MVKRLVLGILLTSLVVGSGAVASAAGAYTPEPGALFNNPYGSYEAKNRLAIKLRKAIYSTPRDSVIRIAVYSFDRKDIGDALADACRRRVSVQIVINDNWTSAQTKRLRKKFGTDVNPHYDDACHPVKKPLDPSLPGAAKPWAEPSFVKICYQACRMQGPGNQHMKIYMFSKSGTARNVIMVGSNNMTYYAAKTHWNDMFTLWGSNKMWTEYSKVYRELALDRPAARRYQVYTDGSFTTEFGALEGAPRSKDPLGRRLDKVGCRATGGTGTRGHTVIRISMYSWVGDRGVFLARKVGGLAQRGCIVKAILSQPARRVKKVLRANGVQIRTADFDTDRNRNTGFADTGYEHFTHEKWMSLNGTWAGAPSRIVWTGSENWSDKSLENDEVTLRIDRAGAHNSYARHFDAMWSNKRYTRTF